MADETSMTASPTRSATEVWSSDDEDQNLNRGRRSQRSVLPTPPATASKDSPLPLGPNTTESVVRSRPSRNSRLEPSRPRESRPSPELGLPRGSASVWTVYRKEYEVDYGSGCLWIASRTDRSGRLALIERCDTHVAKRKRALASQLSSNCFVQCLDVFESGPLTHLVLEPMIMSLVQIATALRFPREQEVLAIVGQILEAFKALAQHGIVHGQVKLSTILVTWQGEVKLVYPTTSTTYTTTGDDQTLVMKDIQALGQVVCDLTKTPGGDDRRLASRMKGLYSDNLFDFVTATNTRGLDALLQLPFLARAWHRSDLLALTWLAAGSSRVQYGQIVHPGAASSETKVLVD